MAMQCAEMVRSPVQLCADWFAGGHPPSWFQNRSATSIFTQSGRAAVQLAARLWNISEADDVLVPAYNCGSEISPLIAAGARVSMYRIDSRAQIDMADLRRRLTPRTRLIHVTHYFGRPTDLEELAALCRERQIRLLEDCALSLFSGGTGETGDAAVYSFYKTLPVCTGGALVLRDAPQSNVHSLAPSEWKRNSRETLSLVKKWVGTSLGLPPRTLSTIASQEAAHDAQSLPDIPASYYCRAGTSATQAFRATLGAVRRTNAADVASKRRNNYNDLHRLLSDGGDYTLLWDRPIENRKTCPLGLPILVRDKPQWCAKLNASGVPVSPWWWGCHKGLDWNQYPEALKLKKELILLPVHQDLEQRHMQHIARVVRSFGTGTKRSLGATDRAAG
ncbi:DegT/DnrJ/EryC1/StrS aminotransferase family protein [Bradyrhizobium genosp. L]|uniref:aminotransferase class V-fold PLP-dependent enzyme n=1 Tax=Bradyrhizobium genosp. L TaxID=83637 RepID=UPI0018A32C0B|nr:aminotransferase class V-fold PLP-dependent enzyme [Bradyrhizobium genosp. L]QPF86542.1 DegT/DnrJ/EryC1/StrS aminotransferase family protein [Bradyrhizobium genosp. L]